MLKTKIKTLLPLPRLLALLTLALLVMLSVSRPLGAQSAFTQGFGSDEPLQKGMIVQIKKSDATKVELNTSQTIDQMYGVVVDANDAPVTLSSEGQKVFIATGGRFEVLVSNQNGDIAAGDYITISALNGIGMRAGTKEQTVVGRALAGFNGKDGVISSSEVKDTSGKAKQVVIGRVSLDVAVTRNPNLKSEEPNLPEALRRAVESIAGKQVSPQRAYLSVIIFIVSAVVAGSLMYSGIRSGIISIGRNPLSKKSIIRGMFQVILTGIIIFITGIFGVYLLLKL
jgi:hypothetical protein